MQIFFVSAAFRFRTKGRFVVLTSTCIQTLYFLQTSEMAMRGSKAPYTVVPAVALTKKGTKPCRVTSKDTIVHEHAVITPVCLQVSLIVMSVCSIYSCYSCASRYLLFRLQYSPLKVSWDHFTTAKERLNLA